MEIEPPNAVKWLEPTDAIDIAILPFGMRHSGRSSAISSAMPASVVIVLQLRTVAGVFN